MSTTWLENNDAPRADSWDAQNGSEIVRNYHGPEAERLEFETNELPAGYTRIERRYLAGDWTELAATYALAPADAEDPTSGLISQTWTLDITEEEHPLSEHDTFAVMAARSICWPMRVEMLALAYRNLIRDAIKANPENPDLPAAITKTYADRVAPPGATDEEKLTARAYFDVLLRNDAPTYPVDVYALRKSQTVTSWSTLKVSHQNVNRLHSYNALVTSEPTLPRFAMLDVSSLGDYVWLKKKPRTSTTTQGNVQIEQEFLGSIRPPDWTEAWSYMQLLYGLILE